MLAGQRELDQSKAAGDLQRGAALVLADLPVVPLVHTKLRRPAHDTCRATSCIRRAWCACATPISRRSGTTVIGYFLRRVLHALATIVVAVALVFIAMRSLPGNPLLARFGQHPDAAANRAAPPRVRLGPAGARAARAVLLAGADDRRPGPLDCPHQRQRQPRAGEPHSRDDRADRRRAFARDSAGHRGGHGGGRVAQPLARPPVDGGLACRREHSRVLPGDLPARPAHLAAHVAAPAALRLRLRAAVAGCT